MGFFDRFESAVEKGVNSVFSKVFSSSLKPVDISSDVIRTMDDAAAKDSGSVPNFFVVTLTPEDLAAVGAQGVDQLEDQVTQAAVQHADSQEYVLLGPVEVKLKSDPARSPHTVDVVAEKKVGKVAPGLGKAASPTHPIIEVDGDKWVLTEEKTVIGRSSKSDIKVDDPGVSRRHIEFRVTPDGVILTDLGSTNGTFVEGNRISAATLLDGNQINIGRTRILFWTHPEEAQ